MKDLSRRSRPKCNDAEEGWIAGRNWSKKRSKPRQRLASNPSPCSEKWTNVAHEVVVSLIPLSPNPRPLLFGILKPSYQSPRSGNGGPDKKSQRERKDQRHQDQELGRNSGTPATGVNATSTSGGARNGGARQDLSQLTCYNGDKKGHCADKCPDPRRTPQIPSNSIGDLRVDDWG